MRKKSEKESKEEVFESIEIYGDSCTYKNWKEQLHKNRERLEDHEMFVNALEEQWKILGLPEKLRKDIESIASSPPEIFNYYIELSLYPPPELLLVLSDMFLTYFSCGGSITLEEVFFGPAKKGVGNYAARKRQQENHLYIKYDLDVLRNKKLKTGLSQVELAEKLFEDLKKSQPYFLHSFSQDIESFIRQYRRWKKSRTDK